MENYAALTPYQIYVDENWIWLITKYLTSYYVCKVDRETLELEASVSPFSGTPYGICADSSYIYWTDSAGNIYRWDGEAVSASLLDTVSGVRGIAVYGSDIYYANNNSDKISYQPKDGLGSESDLITSIVGVYAVFIYGDNIYWSQSGPIKWRAIAGGGTTTLVSGTGVVPSMCVDGTYLYYPVIDGSDTDLCSVPIAGGSDTTLDTIADSTIWGINVAEGENGLYWTDTEDDSVSLSDYLNDYHKLTIDNLTGFDTNFDEIDIYAPIEIVVTWLPKYGNTRALRKNFLAGSFIFSDLDGLEECQWRLSSLDSYIEDTVDDTTFGYLVPIDNARELQLSPSIKIASIYKANWKMVGMSLEMTLQKPRGIRK
jgi:hypothetical protein